MFESKVPPRLLPAYRWANLRSGGALEVFLRAVDRFDRVRAGEAAASIAYYALFSFFPLLLFLAASLGYLLTTVETPRLVMDYVTQVIPLAEPFIEENLVSLLRARGTGGLLGLIGLIWAASGAFTTLARAINRAWPSARLRPYWQGRLIAVGMVGTLSVLLIFAVTASSLIALIQMVVNPQIGAIGSWSGWIASRIAPWLVAFFIFVNLYRWIPYTRVRWSEAFWGALVATIAFEVTGYAVRFFLRYPFYRLEELHGSLSTIIGLLLWIYLTASITLFGAHISAAVAVVQGAHQDSNALED